MTTNNDYINFAEGVLHDAVRTADRAAQTGQPTTPFRISNAGQCTRKMAFQAVAPHLAKEDHSRLILGRMFGDKVHDLARDMLAHHLTDIEKPVTFQYSIDDEVYSVGGHIDGILTLPGQEPRLLEIKSISDAGFDILQYAEGNKYDAVEVTYRGQHAAYRQALNGIPGVFLFVNKNTSHTLWIDVPKEIDHQALSVAVDRRFGLYTWLRARTDEALPPERMRDHAPVAEMKRKKPTGRTILPWQCSYCKFVEACWPNATLNLDSGKPAYVL